MNRIKLLREEKGYTQEELANKISVVKSSIAMYESETRNPSLEVLNKLSNLFKCSIDYLLGKCDIRTYDCDLPKYYKELEDLTPLELDEAIKFAKFIKQQNKTVKK